MPASSDPARLALGLAALGWHILPLSPASKRPLGNCARLPPPARPPRPPGRRLPLPGRGRLVPRRPRRHHRPRDDHRLVAPRAPRGARRRRRALRAGPGRHRRPRRPAPAQPGHRPAARHRPRHRAHPARRVGRPGPVPGRPRQPGPAGPAPRRPPPLAHRARAPAGHRGHPLRRGAPVVPGARPQPPPGPQRPPRPVRARLANRPQSRMVLRHRPRRHHHRRHLPAPRRRPRPPRPHARLARPRGHPRHHHRTTPARHPAAAPSPGGPGPAAYLATVIGRGAVQLAALTDGRKRALSALAYHAGGLLAWSGADREHITAQLIDAGTAAGLGPSTSARIVNRAITNGIDRPVAQPGSRL